MSDEMVPGRGGPGESGDPGAGGTSGHGSTSAPGGMTCDAVREMAGAFVLGALDAAEDAAVREHLASCPEPHPEFAELGGVLPVLAESVPTLAPSEGLKARIMAAAAADLAARSAAYRPPSVAAAGERAGPAAGPASAPRLPRRSRSRRRRSERADAAGRRPLRGSSVSPPSSRSSRSVDGTCCYETSSTAPRRTSRQSPRCSTWPASPDH